MNLLHHIPTWVYFLLAMLIVLGLRQSRTSRTPQRRIIIISVALTFYTLLSLGQLLHTQGLLLPGLLFWGVCNVLVTKFAQDLFAPALAHESHHLIVPGSWAPLTIYLMIFSLRFVHGVLSATSPALAKEVMTLFALAAISGLLSGLVNARSLRLLQLPQAQ